MVDFIIKYVRVSATQLKINFARNLGEAKKHLADGVGGHFNLSKKPHGGAILTGSTTHSVNW